MAISRRSRAGGEQARRDEHEAEGSCRKFAIGAFVAAGLRGRRLPTAGTGRGIVGVQVAAVQAVFARSAQSKRGRHVRRLRLGCRRSAWQHSPWRLPRNRNGVRRIWVRKAGWKTFLPSFSCPFPFWVQGPKSRPFASRAFSPRSCGAGRGSSLEMIGIKNMSRITSKIMRENRRILSLNPILSLHPNLLYWPWCVCQDAPAAAGCRCSGLPRRAISPHAVGHEDTSPVGDDRGLVAGDGSGCR